MKDTMQLAAYTGNFRFGEAARYVNEGLPDEIVRGLGDVTGRRVALLGMAFKAESDDVRDSLSYKLRRLLWFAGADVTCSDPYVDDPGVTVPQDENLDGADIVIVCVPHPEYHGLGVGDARVIDLWGVTSASRAAV